MKISEIIQENQQPPSDWKSPLPPPNSHGWIKVNTKEKWFEPEFFIKPTPEGLLMGPSELDGNYADQDGGETVGTWDFTANLTTGEIKINAEEHNDRGGWADYDAMNEEAKEMVDEFVKKYGRTIAAIEDSLDPAVMLPDED